MTKIIGAHNALTGETPVNWISECFPDFCKCQTKNLKELAQAGVTCYDIRLWFDKNGVIHYGHGLGEYSYPCFSFESLLFRIEYYHNKYNEGQPLYIRMILERSKNNGETLFKTLCTQSEKTYPNIIFFEGRSKKSWEKLYTFRREEELPEVHEYHASVCGEGLCKYMPYRFWQKYGQNYTLQDGINLIDFI